MSQAQPAQGRIEDVLTDLLADIREGYAIARQQKLLLLESWTGVPHREILAMCKSMIEMQACGPIYFYSNGGET